jgi:hypothetical protein
VIGTPKKAIVLRLLQERPELRFNQIGALAQCCGQYVGKLAKDTGYVKANSATEAILVSCDPDREGRGRQIKTCNLTERT